MSSRLADFMANSGQRPYRDLVQHHLRRQLERELRDAATGESLMLPEPMRPHAMTYIDVANENHRYPTLTAAVAAFWSSR